MGRGSLRETSKEKRVTPKFDEEIKHKVVARIAEVDEKPYASS